MSCAGAPGDDLVCPIDGTDTRRRAMTAPSSKRLTLRASPARPHDLAALGRIRPADQAIKACSTTYIMGPEVAQLEKDLAASAARHDLVLKQDAADDDGEEHWSVTRSPGVHVYGDTRVIALIGATPLCDVEDETFNIDPARLDHVPWRARGS
jgi:hypothetical protein